MELKIKGYNPKTNNNQNTYHTELKIKGVDTFYKQGFNKYHIVHSLNERNKIIAKKVEIEFGIADISIVNKNRNHTSDRRLYVNSFLDKPIYLVSEALLVEKEVRKNTYLVKENVTKVNNFQRDLQITPVLEFINKMFQNEYNSFGFGLVQFYTHSIKAEKLVDLIELVGYETLLENLDLFYNWFNLPYSLKNIAVDGTTGLTFNRFIPTLISKVYELYMSSPSVLKSKDIELLFYLGFKGITTDTMLNNIVDLKSSFINKLDKELFKFITNHFYTIVTDSEKMVLSLIKEKPLTINAEPSKREKLKFKKIETTILSVEVKYKKEKTTKTDSILSLLNNDNVSNDEKDLALSIEDIIYEDLTETNEQSASDRLVIRSNSLTLDKLSKSSSSIEKMYREILGVINSEEFLDTKKVKQNDNKIVILKPLVSKCSSFEIDIWDSDYKQDNNLDNDTIIVDVVDKAGVVKTSIKLPLRFLEDVESKTEVTNLLVGIWAENDMYKKLLEKEKSRIENFIRELNTKTEALETTKRKLYRLERGTWLRNIRSELNRLVEIKAKLETNQLSLSKQQLGLLQYIIESIMSFY